MKAKRTHVNLTLQDKNLYDAVYGKLRIEFNTSTVDDTISTLVGIAQGDIKTKAYKQVEIEYNSALTQFLEFQKDIQ